MTIQEIMKVKKAIAKKNNKVEDKQKREKEQQDKEQEQKLSLDPTLKVCYRNEFDRFLEHLSGKADLEEWHRRSLIDSFKTFIKVLEVK